MKNKSAILALIFCVVLVAADRAGKLLAVRFLQPVGTAPLIPGFINLTYVENTGVSFGLFVGGRWVFVIVSLVVMGVIVYLYRKISRERRLLRFSTLLILSGAFGNMIDRLLHGFVVDFFCFEFINFPVFNVADCLIVVGTIMFAAILIFSKKSWTK